MHLQNLHVRRGTNCEFFRRWHEYERPGFSHCLQVHINFYIGVDLEGRKEQQFPRSKGGIVLPTLG